ncbi:MAG TPA: hypothetical protein VK177_17080 [Flavobacteriales bacterium]|nr:hypothetical protein [Flavobacteriales bacterium]
MKKSLALALLFIFLLQSGGLLLIQKIQRANLKWKMEALLERTHTGFEKLTMPVHVYEACKVDRKEIRYHGRMYDVKSATVTGNTVELLVINDTEEERLMESMKAGARLWDEPVQGPQTIVLKFLQLHYVCADEATQLAFFTNENTITTNHEQNLVSITSDIPTPPPRWV